MKYRKNIIMKSKFIGRMVDEYNNEQIFSFLLAVSLFLHIILK